MVFVRLFNKAAVFALFLLCSLGAAAGTELEQQLDRYLQLLLTDAPAATELLEQLESELTISTPMPSRVRLLSYQVSEALYNKQEELFNQRLQQLLAMANQTESYDAIAEIYATELETLVQQQQITAAILKADQVQHFSQLAHSPRVRYYTNNVLAQLFRADSQYERALEHFTLALDAVMATNDERTLIRRSVLHYHIAQVHAELKNWPQAREMTEQLIVDVKSYKYEQFLPELYLLLGYILGGQKEFNAALQVNQQGLAASEALNYDNVSLTFENNLGSIYIELEDYAAAQTILQQALTRANELDDAYNKQYINFNLGYIAVQTGDSEAGLMAMLSVADYFKAQANKAEYEGLLEWIAKAYGAAGMYQLQAETLLEQLALREEILTAERDKVMAELNSRFDTKAKTQQITILQQDNDLKAQLLANQTLQKRITVLFSLVLAFAGVMLFQLYRKVRMSNKRLREANKQLEFQSLRDPLTGLLNRRALQEHMQKRQDLARRHGDALPTGLLILDIDFFKNINDQYGHAAGDAVLIDISKRLSQQCRQEDLVIRWGGEEFLIVLAQPEPKHINALCQRILAAVAQTPVIVDDQQIAVTISGGYIQLPFAGVAEQKLNWERALQIADMALYLSKVSGRNQVHALNGLKTDYASTEALLHSDLSGAIRQDMVAYDTIKGPQAAANQSK